MKRHGFHGGPKTHGQSDRQRAPGSQRVRPPRRGAVYKGSRGPGHMGSERVTSQNLRVELVDPERNLLGVNGSVPGATGRPSWSSSSRASNRPGRERLTMKVDVLNMQGEKVRTVELPAAIFEAPIKEELMHQALVRQLANARLGTRKTKTRGEVRGGGTSRGARRAPGGRAKARPARPHWRGGGTAHTPAARATSASAHAAQDAAARRCARRCRSRPPRRRSWCWMRSTHGRAQDQGDGGGAASGWWATARALVLLAERDEAVEKSVRNLPSGQDAAGRLPERPRPARLRPRCCCRLGALDATGERTWRRRSAA